MDAVGSLLGRRPNGGKDKGYDNREALNKAIEYAEGKINEAFAEIEKRFNLGDE